MKVKLLFFILSAFSVLVFISFKQKAQIVINPIYIFKETQITVGDFLNLEFKNNSNSHTHKENVSYIQNISFKLYPT